MTKNQSAKYNRAKKVTVVIGDSMIKNLQGWHLSDTETYVVVRSSGGATTFTSIGEKLAGDIDNTNILDPTSCIKPTNAVFSFNEIQPAGVAENLKF